MFISRAYHYDHNRQQAANYTASPAGLGTPDGGQEPAVVLRSLGHVHGVLPVADALRLANEIADALAVQKREAN